MVHAVGEFFERSFEGQGFPPLATVKRQAIRAAAERGKTESGISAVLVRTTHDQMAAAGSHGEPTCCLAGIEQGLQRGRDRW